MINFTLSAVLAFGCTALTAGDDTSPVVHKNFQIDFYLDLLKYHTEEKIGILPYILENPEGVYLEVGAGGDPIAQMLTALPKTISPTIIVSDIDALVLERLPQRHPELVAYLTPETGPQCTLMRLDATDMSCIPSNHLAGINASAIVHEIVSYAGGIAGLDAFFKESLRVLKPGGVLIYRDAEAIDHKDDIVFVTLKTRTMRLFAHIFLAKFLDESCSSLVSKGVNSCGYDRTPIVYTIYKKGDVQPVRVSFEQYLQIPTWEIDFERAQEIAMGRGLCREMQRHYLTYLHACNPLSYVQCIPHCELFSIKYLSNHAPHWFEEFLHSHGMAPTKTINKQTRQLLDEALDHAMNVVEYGIPLHIACDQKKQHMVELLERYGFDPSTLIYINNYCVIDYRVFGLLYDHFIDLFDDTNGPINPEELIHGNWLKREGEEVYTYYSDDELISKVAEHTDDSFVLCPVSPSHNTFVPRPAYDQLLCEAMDLCDGRGHPVEMREGKRIIHFRKMPRTKALPIYADIVKGNKPHYQRLNTFLGNRRDHA